MNNQARLPLYKPSGYPGKRYHRVNDSKKAVDQSPKKATLSTA